MRMTSLPGERRFFRFKKSIDDDRVALRHGVADSAGGLPTDYCRSAVDCEASRIRKKHATAKGNPFRIDRAMSGAQPRTIGTCAKLPFAWPVDRDPGEQRLLARESRRGEE